MKALFLGCILAGLSALANAIDVDADKSLARANTYMNYKNAVTNMHMQVLHDEEVETEYEMRVQKLDSDHMRIEFTAPQREKGRKLLRTGDKMFMFLPDLGKSIVISARQSFLGSSFSNGDLLRTDLVADYDPTYLRDESLGGTNAEVLELRAKRADVTYDRIVMWIDKASKRPLRQEFFTLSGKRIKYIEYRHPKHFGELEVNSELFVQSDLNRHESTLLTISAHTVGSILPVALFQKDSFAR